MDSIISQIITEWGTFGIILFGIGYLVWENYKAIRNKRDNSKEVLNAMDALSNKVDNLSDKIVLINDKVDEFKDQIESRIEIMDEKIESMPETQMNHMDIRDSIRTKNHLKQLDDLMKLGPKLHRIIQNANEKIGSDHIFVGSFHNGNSSLSGIPYYKFDIIAERFSPAKIKHDCEFASMYKDADILRFDTLPSLLVQNGLIHFSINKNGETNLSQYDDIIWRRMIGRGIKQIAIRLTRDGKGSPSGFVGVVKYDYSELNLKFLEECAHELEDIYKDSELKEINNY